MIKKNGYEKKWRRCVQDKVVRERGVESGLRERRGRVVRERGVRERVG